MGKLPDAPRPCAIALFCARGSLARTPYLTGPTISLEHDCMPRYMIEREFPERFVIPLSDDGQQRCKDVVDRNAEAGVTWLHSYVSDDHKRSYCVYDGPNPEAIRRTAKQNNLPVGRITEVRVLDPYFYRP